MNLPARVESAERNWRARERERQCVHAGHAPDGRLKPSPRGGCVTGRCARCGAGVTIHRR